MLYRNYSNTLENISRKTWHFHPFLMYVHLWICGTDVHLKDDILLKDHRYDATKEIEVKTLIVFLLFNREVHMFLTATCLTALLMSQRRCTQESLHFAKESLHFAQESLHFAFVNLPINLLTYIVYLRFIIFFSIKVQDSNRKLR